MIQTISRQESDTIYPCISIIDHEGKITHEAPEKYIGLTVDQGREVLKDLRKAKTVSAKDYKSCRPLLQIAKPYYNPLIRDQWFICK